MRVMNECVNEGVNELDEGVNGLSKKLSKDCINE